MEVVIPHK